MRCPGRVLKFIAIAALIISALGFIVMRFWNALIPEIFGLHPLRFGQAVGLLILSKILFGGFHGRPPCGGPPWKRHLRERFEQMTPEEQEKFRSGLKHRCD